MSGVKITLQDGTCEWIDPVDWESGIHYSEDSKEMWVYIHNGAHQYRYKTSDIKKIEAYTP